MVLATAVIIRALHERANFYSACVYLAQSNACLMVLTNVALLGVCTGMVGLQRLFYGPLRPIEVEQLYEKAWFAITETCLAMTIFREEVGGWFLVMFVCLLIGKVWGWIGEGRVEILEQQPPSNPRLFHARLSVSLIISTLFDISMLRYSINTVLRHARPNMMVMFAFEFAVLTITSMSTAARYTISLHEASVISHQIKDRRAQIRREREESQALSATANQDTAPESQVGVAAAEDDIDSLDVDVPGWEEKGRWVFYLDLITDFFKLILYLTFFCVLCMFYGMPIHIIRDVALTIRSFYKRITDFVRYRQATRDMNARYPDATSEEVAREDVCIICREEMRPWQQPNVPGAPQRDNGGAARAEPTTIDERLRPKKLPCGHILHFACLRSWLERQQNCPTCRRPVLVTGTVTRTQEQNQANQHGRAQPQPNLPHPPLPVQGNIPPPVAAQNVINLGPLRIAFGARQVQVNPQQVNNEPHPPHQQGSVPIGTQIPRIANTFGIQRQAPGAQAQTFANFSPSNLQTQIYQIEQQLLREINGLRIQQNQLQLVRALQSELARLRMAQANPDGLFNGTPFLGNQFGAVDMVPPIVPIGTSFSTIPQQQSYGTGHQNLPQGMILPPGWTILPLQRLGGEGSTNTSETSNMGIGVQPQSLATPAPATSSRREGVAPANSWTANGNISASSSSGEGLTTKTATPVPHINGHSEIESHREHTNGVVKSSSNDPLAEVPRWGSTPSSLPMNSQEESSDARATGDSANATESFTNNAQIKGKGKASTVEDSPEDLD